MRRTLLALVATVCAAGAVWGLASGAPAQQSGGAVAGGGAGGDPGQIAAGRTLYAETCSSCHGFRAEGRPGRGPSLVGVGAEAADFYLSTGRMPLNDPDDAPVRTKPRFSEEEIAALTAYVASFTGPPIPTVNLSNGDISEGQQIFAESCSGCHQIMARGGVIVGGIAPPLQQATPTQVAEAVRIGPYLMPQFSEGQLNQQQLESVALYVESTKNPDDRGGWGIGNIGPVPEGNIAWFLALLALLIVARLIGEQRRT
jgi:ubiquinol-cytochrome c reductase cytochrome c subunit